MPGNLFATLLTPAERPAPELSFVAALAVADLALAYVPSAIVTLKWPNDLLVAGRKAVGILVEAGPGWMAVGIGVNLVSAPSGAERTAACLADHLRPDHAAPPTPEQALLQLAAAFERWETSWRRNGLAPILQAWEARAPGAHGPCVARLPAETLTGVAEGLDLDGALRLRLDDGSLRRIAAGDVFFGDGQGLREG
jgi:BirA family biotin operon repressor/biotin-[acetyl-CoA-carboxylase] ligase